MNDNIAKYFFRAMFFIFIFLFGFYVGYLLCNSRAGDKLEDASRKYIEQQQRIETELINTSTEIANLVNLQSDTIDKQRQLINIQRDSIDKQRNLISEVENSTAALQSSTDAIEFGARNILEIVGEIRKQKQNL
jgi:predicted negative regulator of RcsB-dependent stress response